MKPNITEIAHEETINIRHQVMWPDQPVDYVKLPNDDHGQHYGLFIEDHLVSVISLFILNQEVQFRKFATLNEHQGKGYGSLLLKHIMDIAAKQNLRKIWCNARVDKSGYYSKFSMKQTAQIFEKGGIDYVIMERLFD